MVRHASATTHHVNQAEVEGAIAGYFGVSATTPGISDLVRVVFPGVQTASRQNPAGWRSVVLGVLANHIGIARDLGLGGSELQRQLQIMRASNRTSAEFAQARLRVQALVAGMGGWGRVARAVDAGETTNSNSYAVLGSGYSAGNLPMEMRRHLGRYDAAHVAAVGNYLTGLGMHQHEVHQYAGFFVGSSETVRHAIHPRVHHGQALTDEHVTNANDAGAIMGAIRAGRIRPEDAPPSVRRLMEDMRARGVDPATADPQAIQNYLEENPQALEAARRANTADITMQTGVATQEVQAERRRLAQLHGARREPSPETATPAPDAPPPAQPPPRAAGTLDLS